MSELINYLNSPHLVAHFQKAFGIESHFKSGADTGNLVKEDNNGLKHRQNNNNDLKKKIKSKEEEKELETTTNGIIETIGPNSFTDNKKEHKLQLNNVKQLVNNTDHSHIIANTTIHSRFWFYFFHFGASMGNEIFYCLFFPFWFWNIDGAIARKVGFLWGIFMYVGQATKDLLCMPRPASPPVVKLEERYVAEFGFPSTHAMVAAGLPISVVVLSYSRYNIDLTISITIAVLFCCWVCCSRLYLGMHSLLDVIAGVLYSVFMLILLMPVLETVDSFMILNEFAPFITIVSGFALCYFYPSLKQWSTARGDTTIIIGTVVGFSVGSYLNNYFGLMIRPNDPPRYDIVFPNALGYLLGVLRSILGLFGLYLTRVFFKSSLLRFLCHLNGVNVKDPACKKEKKIELPYNYITYFFMGVNISFFSPLLFRMLNIERDYRFTEL